jgi:hypothetical protein
MRRFFVSGFEVSETKEPSIACVKVMTQVARDGRAPRESLYKALLGNRSFILKALGAFSLHAKAVKTWRALYLGKGKENLYGAFASLRHTNSSPTATSNPRSYPPTPSIGSPPAAMKLCNPWSNEFKPSSTGTRQSPSA